MTFKVIATLHLQECGDLPSTGHRGTVRSLPDVPALNTLQFRKRAQIYGFRRETFSEVVCRGKTHIVERHQRWLTERRLRRTFLFLAYICWKQDTVCIGVPYRRRLGDWVTVWNSARCLSANGSHTQIHRTQVILILNSMTSC